MQSVSSSYKELIKTNISLSPKSKVVIDGVEYLGDVIKTSPKISHSNTSFIGGFPAKTVSFDIFNLNNDLSLENKEIEVYRGLVINGVVEWVKQGVFIPQAKDITHDITTRTISVSNAQDRTQLFDNQYKSSLDWTNGQTHTGLEIVQEICTRLNVTLEKTNFAWSNYSFKQPNFSELTTDREVISRLAEIGGEVALISSNGGLAIKGQYNTGDTVQRQRYKSLSREKPFVANTVVLGKEGIDDDIVYPETISNERAEIKILDNPYVDLYRQEMIEAVASHIIGKSYIPFSLNEFVDGFIYELNDVVNVIDKTGETFEVVILDYSSASRIKSNIKAEQQGKTTTNYKLAGSTKETINQVKLEVDHINNTITALSSRIEDLTDYLTSASGTGSVVLEKTVESNGSIGKLVMTGFTEMPLYPNMAYPSKKTYANKLTSYTIVQTNGTDTHETYLELEMSLSGTDELIIENNKVYVKRNNKVTDMNLLANLKTFKGTTTISVKFFNNIKFTCDYIIENEFTKLFSTQAEVSAQWLITNESINSKVSKAEVISEINQSAESVGIKADKIKLEGLVTANQNFKVLEDGSIEAKNGSFSGNIYLTNGGSIVSDKGLLTSIVVESNIKSRSFIGGNMMLPMGYSLMGSYEDGTPIITKDALMFEFTMPKGFSVRDAYVIIQHMPVEYKNFGTKLHTGYSRNLKLYQSSGFSTGIAIMDEGMFNLDFDNLYFNEVTNAFGENGFTGSDKGYTSQKSIDIKEHIQTSKTEDKFNILKIETGNNIVATDEEVYANTGSCKATLIIQGYTSFE